MSRIPGEPERFELTRDRAGPLVFNGFLLGSSSTKRPGKTRWTEINIYRSAATTYVLEVLGCTSHHDERTVRTVTTHGSAGEVFTQLIGTRRRLSAPAYDALDNAACVDPKLDELLTKYETTAEFIS